MALGARGVLAQQWVRAAARRGLLGAGRGLLLWGPGPGECLRGEPATTRRRPGTGPGQSIELGDLQEQVTTGHAAATAYVVGGTDAVDVVEAASQHQPLDHRS